jgi:hypothetical protein
MITTTVSLLVLENGVHLQALYPWGVPLMSLLVVNNFEELMLHPLIETSPSSLGSRLSPGRYPSVPNPDYRVGNTPWHEFHIS